MGTASSLSSGKAIMRKIKWKPHHLPVPLRLLFVRNTRLEHSSFPHLSLEMQRLNHLSFPEPVNPERIVVPSGYQTETRTLWLYTLNTGNNLCGSLLGTQESHQKFHLQNCTLDFFLAVQLILPSQPLTKELVMLSVAHVCSFQSKHRFRAVLT